MLLGEEQLIVLVDLREEVLGHELLDLGEGDINQFFLRLLIGHDAIALVNPSKDVWVDEETVG